jgi:hypothetical protein
MTKEELLNRALGDLGKRYPIGLYEYLYKHRPDLYRSLIELENSIDQIYPDSNASIDQLKAVLRDYWTFHMTAIREFKQLGQLDLDLSQVRQEMADERIRA